ncbi:MAG: class I SAM-dependent methyltransferase, partial [Gemmatimonadota bacterium]|nr:class I SAM-dependent methyltransferase [Gemmatimonadota bacterium]
IPDLRTRPDPYIAFGPDRDKARAIADAAATRTFEQLVEWYYGHTDVVPAKDARLYTRGLLTAAARSRQTLEAWARVLEELGGPRTGAFLDLGCGTAPLAAAALGRFRPVIGVDIALRWLVVARRRLADLGLDVPLICACAEALPFRDQVFDVVGMESVLETVLAQDQAADEVHRALTREGAWCLTTPNRFSIGPDPHTGLPGGSLLPASLVAAYVRRKGGIPPHRRLLSAWSLRRLVARHGFPECAVFPPEITPEQRASVSRPTRIAVDVYQAFRRLPGAEWVLRAIGPLHHAVALKA